MTDFADTLRALSPIAAVCVAAVPVAALIVYLIWGKAGEVVQRNVSAALEPECCNPLPKPDASDAEFEAWVIEAIALANSHDLDREWAQLNERKAL